MVVWSLSPSHRPARSKAVAPLFHLIPTCLALPPSHPHSRSRGAGKVRPSRLFLTGQYFGRWHKRHSLAPVPIPPSSLGINRLYISTTRRILFNRGACTKRHIHLASPSSQSVDNLLICNLPSRSNYLFVARYVGPNLFSTGRRLQCSLVFVTNLLPDSLETNPPHSRPDTAKQGLFGSSRL